MKIMNKVAEISALLVDNKLISFNDMYHLYEEFKDRSIISFQNFLLEEGLVSKENLLKVLSQYYKVPYFDTIGAFFDHQFIHLIPKEVMLQHYFIPVERDIDSDILTVVAAEPDDPHLLEVLGEYIFHEINFMVGLPRGIIDSIQEFYDASITNQPNYIQNELMERSMIEVNPTGEELFDERNHREIPLVWEQTIDDSERY